MNILNSPPNACLAQRSSQDGPGCTPHNTLFSSPLRFIRAGLAKSALLGLAVAGSLLGGNARAQIAFQDGSLTQAVSSSNSVSLPDFTVTPGANVLVVSLLDRDNNSTYGGPASLAWGSQTLQRVLSLNGGSTYGWTCLYYLFNPTPGTQTITATDTSGGTVSAMIMQAYTLSGVDTTVAPVAYTASNGGTTFLRVTLPGSTPAQAWAAVNAYNGQQPNTLTLSSTSGTVSYSDTNYVINSAMGYIANLNAVSNTITASATTSQKATLGVAVFTPLFAGPAAPTGLTVTGQQNRNVLSWTDGSGGTAASYIVWRATAGGAFTAIATNSGAGNVTYNDTSVVNYTTYSYYVQAVGTATAGGCSAQASASSYGVAPAPTGLAAVGYGTQAALSWDIPAGNPTSYNLLRSTTSGGETIIATGLTATYYNDTGLTTGTTYYYVVQAVNSYGTSAKSTEASTTPQPLPAPNGIISIQDGALTNGMIFLYTGNNGSTSPAGLQPPTITKTVTVTPGASVLVVPFYIQYTNAGLTGDLTPATLAWGSQTLTKAISSTNPPSSGIAALYYLFNPIPGTHPLSYTDTTGKAVWELAINAYTLNNVDTTIAPDGRGSYSQWGNDSTLRAVYTNTLGAFVAALATDRNGGLYITSTTGTPKYQYIQIGSQGTPGYANQDVLMGGVLGLAPGVNTINHRDNQGGTPRNFATAMFARLNVGPSAPVYLTAMGQQNQIALSWMDTSGGNATGYYVLRSTTSGSGYTVVGTVNGASTTTYTDTTVGNYTNYYYVVQAFNSLGYGDYSAEASAFSVGAPKTPTGLAAVGYGTSVALSWNVESSASSYNVLRSMTSGSGFAMIASGLPTPYFTDAGLTTGTTYYYMVEAVNDYGTSAHSAETSATPQPLPAPTGEIAVQDGSLTTFTNSVNSATVSQPFTVTPGASVLVVALWDQNSQTNDINTPWNLPIIVKWRDQTLTLVSGQQVNREQAASAIYYLLDPTPGTDKVTATDQTTGPVLGMAMQVYTLNNVDNSQLPWIAGWADDFAQVNTGVSADFSSMGTPNGSFVAVSAASGSGANSLHSEHIVSSSGTVSYIDKIVGNDDVAMGGAANLVTGNALIRATNSNGGIAGIIAAALFPPMVLGPTAPVYLTATGLTNQIALAWEDTSGGTTARYIVLRSTSSTGGFAPVHTNTGLANVTWTDTNVVNYTVYYYEVKAVNAGGSSAPSTMASAFAVGVPPTPTGLVGLWGNNQATLTWNAASNATSYHVLRSRTSGSGYTPLATVTTPGYVDTTATNYGTYYYVVNAVDEVGTSANTPQVAVTPGPGPATIAVLDGSFASIISTNTNSISTDFTVSPGASVLVVTLFDRDGAASDLTPATLAWGSQTLTKCIGQYELRDTLVCAIYYLFNPAPGTQTITVTDTSVGPVTAMAMQVYTLTGIDTNQVPSGYGSANDYTHPYATDGGNRLTIGAATPVGAFAALSASVGGNQNPPIAATIVATGGTPSYGTQTGLSGGYGVMMGGVTNLLAGSSIIAVSHNTEDGIGTDLAVGVFAPAAAGLVQVLPPPTAPTVLPVALDSTGANLVSRVETQIGYNYYLLTTPSLTPPINWTTNSITPGTGGTITNLVPFSKSQRSLFLRYQVR